LSRRRSTDHACPTAVARRISRNGLEGELQVRGHSVFDGYRDNEGECRDKSIVFFTGKHDPMIVGRKPYWLILRLARKFELGPFHTA
jgi:hypothetical protein